jgi:hypothetical protein
MVINLFLQVVWNLFLNVVRQVCYIETTDINEQRKSKIEKSNKFLNVILFIKLELSQGNDISYRTSNELS